MLEAFHFVLGARKVDARLPGKGNSNSHGARPVDLIITMIKWTRTSRLSVKNSLSYWGAIMSSERKQGFSAEQVPVSAYGGSLNNLKDLKGHAAPDES